MSLPFFVLKLELWGSPYRYDFQHRAKGTDISAGVITSPTGKQDQCCLMPESRAEALQTQLHRPLTSICSLLQYLCCNKVFCQYCSDITIQKLAWYSHVSPNKTRRANIKMIHTCHTYRTFFFFFKSSPLHHQSLRTFG